MVVVEHEYAVFTILSWFNTDVK